MVFKNMFNFLSDIAEMPLFRKTLRFMNVHFSPKNDILINVKGHRMYANTLDRLIALYLWKFSLLGNSETKIFEKLIKKKMIVFDIGANIGFFSLIFADMVGIKGKVYAFEPDPSNYRLLVKSIKANGYKNIIAIQKAISNKFGTMDLYISEEHRGDHRSYDPGDGRKVINVEATTVDELVNKKINPDIIKIDIQGSEFLAFSSMAKTIKKNKNLTIISEFWPSSMRRCGYSPYRFLSMLDKYGFKLKFINEKKGIIESINASSLMKICKANRYVNLFLKR